ncbi:MAG: M28 family peptidase [Candidatus Sericytochromatia bacterium]|nr:M28 family peptidase [Candidatus Sericytochromatia bacterium]
MSSLSSLFRYGLALCLSVSLTSPGLASTAAAAPEGHLLSETRQLIFDGKRSGEGYFSADGNKLIFQSEREADNPFFQIYLLDLLSGDTRRVSTGVGKSTCAWLHPNGQQALYASTHHDPQSKALQQAELDFRASGQQRRYSWDYDPQYEIYRSQLGSDEAINLTRTLGYDAEASYSPDGKQIVFASNRAAYSRKLSSADAQRLERDPAYFIDLYIMNSDGSNVRQLTDHPGYDGGPFFSADGKKITFRRFNAKGDKAEIYTMNLDGSDLRQITRLGVMSWAPYFHPSGDYLIFATNKHGYANFELYMVDAAGQKEPVRVTEADGFDGLPVFSPDGQQLVWTSGRTADGASQLFSARWNDALARQLLDLGTPQPRNSSQSTAPAAPADPFATTAAISASDLSTRVHHLASAEMGGRGTGSAGEARATVYAAEVFQRLGLTPAGDSGSYFQHFEFTAGVELNGLNSLRAAGQNLRLQSDWQPLVFSDSGRFEAADVVFAGYGLKAPANGDFKGYDSYVHLDVKDKWVLVLRYWPENLPAAEQKELKRYADLRYKAIIAREQGARGLLVVSGPNSPDQKSLIPFDGQRAPGTVSIPALSLSNDAVSPWFTQAGQDLSRLQQNLDQGKAVSGIQLPVQLSAEVSLKRIRQRGRNVLAMLPVAGAERTLVIGAHLDHLGTGPSSSSLARQDGKDLIHYGADDNASGSAGVLEIAEQLSQQAAPELKQNLLFALWSGEEIGLLGASHFVEQFSEARFKQQFSAYLNMDMIGRYEKALVVQGVGSSPAWKGLLERQNVPVGLPLVLQESAYLPTDATPFYVKGLPALSFFTGAHSDYHTPGDTADKLNYPATARIVTLMQRLATALASQSEAPAYQKQAPPQQSQSRGLRVYLGTIPDYASDDLKGVKISGTTAGSPAEKAGLQSGDVIVQLGDKVIENIYDYTYAIDSLQIGKAVKLVIVRQGQRVELQLIPGSRN